MTVKELVERLEALPQGAPIFLASDGEGNQYSRLDELDLTNVRKDEVVHGRYEDSLIYDDELEDWTPDDVRDLLEAAVVLWPI